jgi:ATP-binding cassette, subfamily C (CFTR/MRP), member 1
LTEIWLKFTTGAYVPPVGVFIGVFAAVAIITWNAVWADIAQVLINIGPKSAIRLHEVLVKTAFNAPMSFFQSTDTSVLVTRFSKDMSLVEMSLPVSMWLLLSGNALSLVTKGLDLTWQALQVA